MVEFVVQLRQLSEHCRFGDTLSDMLCDRIVCGINNQCIQCRLLAESDLILAKAMEPSLTMESADKDADTLKARATGKTDQLVLKMQETRGRGHTPPKRNPRRADQNSNATCYWCHGKHLATVCQFKDTQCHSCGKKGHISKACRSRQTPADASRKNKKP